MESPSSQLTQAVSCYEQDIYCNKLEHRYIKRTNMMSSTAPIEVTSLQRPEGKAGRFSARG